MTNPPAPQTAPAPQAAMDSSAIPDPKSLLEGFNRAIQSLEAALAELQAGKRINIDGLDAEIERLCADTVRLTGPEADPVLERMGTMTEILERLSLELRNWMNQSEPREQREAQGKHRTASAAYRTPGQDER